MSASHIAFSKYQIESGASTVYPALDIIPLTHISVAIIASIMWLMLTDKVPKMLPFFIAVVLCPITCTLLVVAGYHLVY
jgi:hypothetical protein